MKLIQKLERKLSWRKKNYNFPTTSSSKAACDVANDSLMAANLNSTTVNVSGTEFSRYIRFDSMVDPQPLPGITYEMVKIKPNNPQTPPRTLRIPQNHRFNGDDHQSSLSECKENLDDHANIYDDLISQQPIPSRNDHHQQQAKDVRVRNRIRTNPWFNSRFGLNNILKSSIGGLVEENLYESIDHLNEATVTPSVSPSSSSSSSSPPSSSSMSTFDRPIKSFKSNQARRPLASPAILLDKTNCMHVNDDQPTAGGGRSTFLKNIKANDTTTTATFTTVEATKISRKSYLNRLSCCKDKDQPPTKNKPIHDEYQYRRMNAMEHERNGYLKRKLPMVDNEEWPPWGSSSPQPQQQQQQLSSSSKKMKRKEMKLPKKINKLITELKMVHEAIEEIKNFDDNTPCS